MNDIKAIIFDCDGTILDSERIYINSWNIIGKAMGYDIPMEVILDNRGKSKSYGKQNLLNAMGADFPIDEINEKRNVLNEELFRQSDDIVKPGVKELAVWMKEHQILSAVASAKSVKITSDHLQYAGIDNLFDVIMGGDMVEQNKPEPDLFLKAAEELKVTPEECLVIGDTSSDVKAAEAAGMRVIVVPDLVPVDDEMERKAWFILKQIDECIPIIQREGIANKRQD